MSTEMQTIEWDGETEKKDGMTKEWANELYLYTKTMKHYIVMLYRNI